MPTYRTVTRNDEFLGIGSKKKARRQAEQAAALAAEKASKDMATSIAAALFEKQNPGGVMDPELIRPVVKEAVATATGKPTIYNAETRESDPADDPAIGSILAKEKELEGVTVTGTRKDDSNKTLYWVLGGVGLLVVIFIIFKIVRK